MFDVFQICENITSTLHWTLLKLLWTHPLKTFLAEYRRNYVANFQRDLFECLAFYNGADPPLIESDLPGVRMFHAEGPIFQRTEGQPTIWQTGGVADLLFEMLDQHDPRLCSTMIAGLCKYRSDESVKRAWQLLQV